MISAKLIKTLEKKGFSLEFPEYGSPEEIVLEIIKENNDRLNLSLPLFLKGNFNYSNVISKLNNSQIKEFNKIILISEKIYDQEKLKNNLKEIITLNKIKSKFLESEFKNYLASFRECYLNSSKEEQRTIEKQTKLRLTLDLNKSLHVLFSPAKIRIIKKIFNHEKLTNTELKYYYRAISNIDKAVLNLSLQDYLRIIELSKKEVE